MSERVDHAAVASALIAVDPWRGTFDATREAIARSQVHAILALVEQQRIANLIALEALLRESGFGVLQGQWADVTAALGLVKEDDGE